MATLLAVNSGKCGGAQGKLGQGYDRFSRETPGLWGSLEPTPPIVHSARFSLALGLACRPFPSLNGAAALLPERSFEDRG